MKYPKLTIIAVIFFLAYLFLYNKSILSLEKIVLAAGLTGSLVAGILYAYGFTAAIGTAILLISSTQQNIILTGLIAGIGAMIGDIFIFSLIRHPLRDEIKQLKKEKIIKLLENKIPLSIKKYTLPIIAMFVIASPLPDELGVGMLATTKIREDIFTLLSYLLNTAGIFFILLLGKEML